MAKVIPGRFTAQTDEAFVVFIIGLRVNKFFAFRRLKIWRNLPGTKTIHTWKRGVVSIKTLVAMAVLVFFTKPFLSRQGSTRHSTGTCPSLGWRPQPITFLPPDGVKPHVVVSVDRTNRRLPRQYCL